LETKIRLVYTTSDYDSHVRSLLTVVVQVGGSHLSKAYSVRSLLLRSHDHDQKASSRTHFSLQTALSIPAKVDDTYSTTETMRRLRNGVLIVAAAVAISSVSASETTSVPSDALVKGPIGRRQHRHDIVNDPFYDISDFSEGNVSHITRP
jgi:hypothetical protein